MQDLKCESPPFKSLVKRKLYQVAFCSHRLQHAFVLLTLATFTKSTTRLIVNGVDNDEDDEKKDENGDNNDDEVDETNVCPLWLVYNELVGRRHKKLFRNIYSQKKLLSDTATP